MDLAKEAEIVFRDAGYVTQQWLESQVPMISFENETIIGFAHFFGSSNDLLHGWESAEEAALDRFRFLIRSAGEKAWNVYSIFLAPDDPTKASTVELMKIEENFRQTRKIAKGGITSNSGIVNALLPLIPIQNRPVLDEINLESRLKISLSEIHQDGASALLGGASAKEIAQILAEKE